MEYWAKVGRGAGALVATFPELPGCVTEARNTAQLASATTEAVELWLETALLDGWSPPRPRRPRAPGMFPVRISARLAARLQLRWARQDAGLSQSELAERVGVTQQQIALLESPGANLRLSTLERVAHALGLDLELRLQPRKTIIDQSGELSHRRS